MSVLQDSLRAVGLTQRSLARAVGIGEGHMSRILSGEIKPRLPLALRLEAESKGALKAAVLMGLPDHPSTPPQAA